MPSAALRAARKHPLALHHDLPSVCWSCLISRNARLASTSSKASTEPPPERKSPDHPRTTIANYNAGQRVSLSSQINGHRKRALEHQRSADARFTPANNSGSRSFHTTTAARQQQITSGDNDHIKLKPDGITAREFLAQWQKEHGVPNQDILDELGLQAYPGVSTGPGNLVKSGIPVKDEHQSNVNEEELDQPQDLAPPDEGVEHVLGAMHFTTGDMVEIAVGERDPVLGIVMRIYTNNAALVQVFTEEGKWGTVNQVKIQFAVSNFVPQSLVKPVLKYLPDKVVDAYEADVEFNHPINIPREESAPILDKLRDFSSKAHAIYRQNAARLENAHALLSHPTDLRFGSLQKITQTLLQIPKPPPEYLYAVRKGINHHQMSFLIDKRSHRLTGMYQIVSHEFKASVMTARDWIREWQEYQAEKVVGQFDEAELKRKLPGAVHVQNYLEKARRLITESRKTRDPHLSSAGGSPGPSKVKRVITPQSTAIKAVESEKFTKEDRVLIRYLEAYALSNTLHGSTQLLSTPPILLAASEMYPGRTFIDHTTAFCFLVETGVIPPFENRSKYDPHLLVPTAQYSKPLDAMYKWLSRPSRQNAIENDSMEDLRKDWGDMTVFCVDSASAEEIDDGVSVESIPGSDDHWVHVHVANPTAFLKIDSGMAKMAAHMTESIYFPERTFPMLPKWAVDSCFSLGHNTNCLTISSRVGKDAAVKDIKIQNGFIRNVVSITPETMASLLSPDALSTKIFDVIVGGDVPPIRRRDMKSINDLTSRHVEELKSIHEIALGLLKKRQMAGGVSLNQSPPEISVFSHYEKPGLPWMMPSRDQARFYEGDPVIKMTVTPTESMFDHGNDAGFVIQELMLLAGESAATWCSARDVPIIYRGTRDNPNNFTKDELLEKFGDMQADPRPNASMVWVGNFMKSAGYSTVDTKIIPHRVLGLSGYTKCTSPLRRYGDMMVHWQIESALRQEAEGVDLMRKKGKKELAFTKAYVASVLTRMSPRERLITKTKRLANKMWVANVFQRGIHYGEWDCPRIFKGIVYNLAFRDAPYVGLLWPEFSLEVQMDMPTLNGIDDEVQIGDVWEVELHDVNMFSRRIETKPLRLIDRLTIPEDFPGDIRRKYDYKV